MASDFLAPVVEMQMHDNGIRVQYVRSLRTELVQPVISPRFIPTCTPELLQGLGKLARKYDCHVQSHLSESHDEMEFTAHLHPGEGSDADIFDRYGLLTDKCVMAHGVHINQDDAHLLRMRGAAVAHCPLSNVFFGDGVLATAKLVSMGNKVGLGTDVAGGYSPCMLSMIRNAVIADRSVRQGGRHSFDFLATTQKTGADRSAAITSACAVHKANLEGMPDKMDWRHALYLATMGGAQALGIDKQVGTIEVGKSFDAVLLDVSGGGIDLFDTDGNHDILEKLLNLGTEHNVSKVWVGGRSVHYKPVYRGQQQQQPNNRPSSGQLSLLQPPQDTSTSTIIAGANNADPNNSTPTNTLANLLRPPARTDSSSWADIELEPSASALFQHVLPQPRISPHSSPTTRSCQPGSLGPESPMLTGLAKVAARNLSFNPVVDAKNGAAWADKAPSAPLPTHAAFRHVVSRSPRQKDATHDLVQATAPDIHGRPPRQNSPASSGEHIPMSGYARSPHHEHRHRDDIPTPPPLLNSPRSFVLAQMPIRASPWVDSFVEAKKAEYSPRCPPEPFLSPPQRVLGDTYAQGGSSDENSLCEYSFSETEDDVGAC